MSLNNSLNYTFIEFTNGGYYIILKNDKSVKSDKYTLSSSDSTLVTLANLGNLKINSVNSSSLDFTITPTGSSSSFSAKGTAGTIIPNGTSNNTNLLCQNWNMYKLEFYDSISNVTQTTLYPQTYQNSVGTIHLSAIFTNFGTYLITQVDRTITGDYDTTYNLSNRWTWANSAQDKLYYSHDTTGAISSGPVNIVSLNNNNSVFTESMGSYKSTYYLSH